jgi:hypothetical protein
MATIRVMMGKAPTNGATCKGCGNPIKKDEPRMHLEGGHGRYGVSSNYCQNCTDKKFQEYQDCKNSETELQIAMKSVDRLQTLMKSVDWDNTIITDRGKLRPKPKQ